MEPRRGSNTGRIIAGVTLTAALVGGGAATYLVLGRDGGGADTTAAGGAATADVVSAEEGAEARARMDQYRAGSAAGLAAESAGGRVASADAALAVECGPGGEIAIYEPTEEEIATANADTDALAATFDTYGIGYKRVTDLQGFAYLEWDSFDVVAQSVHDSFWAARFPVEPPSREDLDRVKAENDVIARYLTEVGVEVTRTTDDVGWEMLEYDYEDPAAQEAVNAAYAELYPPVPPTAEEIAAIKADNDKLAAAFDAAGVGYTRVSDELGWEWLEWDYEDPVTQEKVDAVFAELYPVEPCLAAEGDAVALPEPATGDAVVQDGSTGEGSAGGGSSGEVATSDEAVDELIVDPIYEPTPEQVAQRDAEAAALVNGFEAAAVAHELVGESPWQSVTFDLANPAGVTVVADILAARP